MLREAGITDPYQQKAILDFVYRLCVIAADIYIEQLKNEKQHHP